MTQYGAVEVGFPARLEIFLITPMIAGNYSKVSFSELC
jgi:hypothetical protein